MGRVTFCFALLMGILNSAAAWANDDTPCSTQLKDKAKIAGAAPEVCLTTSRLVPGRDVVLALWMTDPDSPAGIPFAAVMDRRALESGRKQFLYRRAAQAEALQPFLYNGKSVEAAIGDFDGSGRVGWAMWVVPDTDYFFAVTVYDPHSNQFVEPSADTDPPAANAMYFPATDVDAMVRVTDRQILVPMCDASGKKPSLYFNVWRAEHGRYVSKGRMPAAAATAAEHAKCAAMGQ